MVPPARRPSSGATGSSRTCRTSRWTSLSPQALRDAIAEPVILHGDQPAVWRAPHFTWQVRRQLEAILGSAEQVETGGYRVITTLDWRAQQLAERTVAAAVIAPNIKRSRAERLLDQLKVPRADRGWIRALRGKDLHNAALVALDYRTGDVRAYVGSGGYYRDSLASRRFNPKYDAAGVGTRQPGSAFKPIVYATAFERRTLTPGSLLLDITTEFAPAAGWAPRTRTSWSGGRCSSATRSRCRSTSRRSGPSGGRATTRWRSRRRSSGCASRVARRPSARRGSPARSAPSRCGRSTSRAPTVRSPTAASGWRPG